MASILRVVVTTERVADDWSVAITPDGDAAPLARRTLRRLTHGTDAVPAPPAAEVAALPADERATPWGTLCAADDAKPVLDALRRLAARALGDDTITTVGRYLFATLLGGAWADVLARARADEVDCVELALRWPAGEWALTRMPWELLRSEARFLAAERGPRVAVTRLVTGAVQEAAALPAPIRALFVIAGPLGSPKLRPGAEYLALVRRLRGEALALNARVVLDASPARLRDAVTAFRPSVVHVISHGQLDDRLGAATLELAADDARERRPAAVDAEALDAILRSAGAPPSVVVLNACFTSAAVPQVSVPLSAQLVERGIPVVVGMAGRVADRACRLFTRRFYEALLRGEPIAVAVAEGRAGAFNEGGVPVGQSVDWALPTVTMGERVPASLAVADADHATWVEAVAREYTRIENPPVLCGRLECLEAFPALFAAKGSKRVMVLDAAAREDLSEAEERRDGPSQYGKTRLLEALAVAAIRDGRVPCFLPRSKKEDPPATALAFAGALARAIHDARRAFGLPTDRGYEALRLTAATQDPARVAELGAAVRMELDLLGEPPGSPARATDAVVAAAVRTDLAALAADADAKLAPVVGPRVVVLVDDAHRFGEAASALVEKGGLLGPNGLGSPDAPVPVVIAYSSVGVAQEHGPAVAALTAYAQTRSPATLYFRLGAFGAPDADHLPYRQFLLGIDRPLVFRPDAGEAEERVLAQLHKYTRGVPSRFELLPGDGGAANARVQAALETAVELGALVEADDEAVLKAIAAGGHDGDA